MRRPSLPAPRRALLVLGLLLVVAARAAEREPPRGDEEAPAAQLDRLRKKTQKELEEFFRGKGPGEVRERLGPPHRIARQIFYQGRLEQWVYEGVCRVEFLFPQGKEAHFQSVHSLSRRNR